MSPAKDLGAELEFALTEEQEMIRDTARKFTEDSLEKGAEARDASLEFARAEFDALGELGFPGLTVSDDRGGAGMEQVAAVIAFEELARAGASTSMSLATHLELGARLLDRAASSGAADLESSIEELAAGSKIASCSGLAGEFSVDGGKVLGRGAPTPNATVADLFVVRVVDGDATRLCTVSKENAGVSVEALDAPLGLRNAGLGSLVLDGVDLANMTTIATGAAADDLVERSLAAMRLATAAALVGLADSARVRAVRYSQERIAFGKPLSAQQAVALKLGRMTEAVFSARQLVRSAARAMEEGRAAPLAAALAKSVAGEAAVRCADEAIQIHGGYGFVTEYEVERLYRDGKVCCVLFGDEDACRLEVANGLLTA
ncbi:MAG: acyl-CoA dehydrogenase family protein [Planctomycetes bacterium]|nr:acyl-CoA dehydrogenase family protein [Planctomycetota bacterium]MCB9917246.1 acyl-CoA dehydrogenase family protein [Planctomycetota bacterium]